MAFEKFVVVAVVAVSAYPEPPIMTDVQRAVRAAKAREASAASAKATPFILALLASEEVQRRLALCCPEAASLGPTALLESIRADPILIAPVLAWH